MLGQIRGVDGIKTGYTRASGFNLVSSVEDRGRSIVAVVLGGRTGKSRNAQMAKLIKKYLPKASKGRDRMIVAKKGKKTVFASIFKAPKKAATPTPRPEIKPVDNIVTAAVAPSRPQAEVPTPKTAPKVEAASNSAPSVRVESGWHVQIGAMPSKENAISQLEKARKKLPGVLASTVNYTETVDKNGTKLYRARFAGFTSKDAAWGACNKLKKVKFNCLALAQN